MKSAIVKRSVVLDGRKTSVSVEDDFWHALREIAVSRGERLSHLIARIDTERTFANLSSAIRLFVLGCYRDQYNGELRLTSPSAEAFIAH
jgi:predicted DNA-binding ribbon-helix-helix protein